MKKISVGIIGAGEIAQNFHLPLLKSMQNVQILAIVDRVKSKANTIAHKFEIPFVCESLDEMLSIDSIDAIFICTPNDLHFEMSLACIEAGKTVFIEKPVALNYHESSLLASKANEKNVKVMVGMNQRFRNDAKMIKSYIQNGELGRILYIKSGWIQKVSPKKWKHNANRAGGGVVVDLALSLIDSILWMYNFAEVSSVKANTFNRMGENVEDLCIATINFKDGSLGLIECAWTANNAKTNFYFDVYGNSGSAHINPLEIHRKDGDILKPHNPSDQLTNLTIYRKSYEAELKHFTNSFLNSTKLFSDISEANQSMRVLDAVYDSAETGKEISF